MLQTPINYKHVILSVLAIAFGLLSFWSWQGVLGFIIDGNLSVSTFLWPIISLVLAASFFSFAIIFIKTSWLVYLTILASTAPAFFFLGAGGVTVWALLATIFFVILIQHRVRHEMELSTGFSLSKTLKSGLPLYFTVASLIISVFYFEATKSDETKIVSSLFPKSASSAVLKLLSGRTESLLGVPLQIRSDASVDEIMLQFIKEQLQGQGVRVESLPRRELENLIVLQRREIAQKFNLPALTGKEKLADVLHEVIIGQLTNFLGPYKNYLPIVSAVAFFLAFKTFTIPLYYLTLVFSFFLLKVSIWGKIVKKEKVQIEVEKLFL